MVARKDGARSNLRGRLSLTLPDQSDSRPLSYQHRPGAGLLPSRGERLRLSGASLWSSRHLPRHRFLPPKHVARLMRHQDRARPVGLVALDLASLDQTAAHHAGTAGASTVLVDPIDRGQPPLGQPDPDLLSQLLGREQGHRHDRLRPFPRFLRREPRTAGAGTAGARERRRPEAALRMARLAAAKVAPKARAIDTARLFLPAPRVHLEAGVPLQLASGVASRVPPPSGPTRPWTGPGGHGWAP
jgi:hypothetical protein